MSVTINGTSGLVFNDASTQNTAATGFGFKNRIINGAMTVNQRGGTISAAGTSNTYGLDRFAMRTTSGSAVVSMQQSTTAPTGFYNSLLCTVTTADASLAAGDLTALFQKIEGVNVFDLGWGTADAQPVTISFKVRSSIAGTYGVGVQNDASNRSYPSSFVINSADTWETKTITIAGDTTGTWNLGTTSTAIYLWFSLGAGSTYTGTANTWAAADYRGTTGQVNWTGTNGATFYITGVQLEKGSTATSFDYRPYGTELALCQRYYWNATVSGNTQRMFIDTSTSGNRFIMLTPPSEMRANPTISLTVSSGTPNLYGGTSKIIQAYAALGNSTGNSDLSSLTASAEL
jgi:hypothetical protein